MTKIQADLTQLYSPYAVLMDLDSETVIAEQKGRERIYQLFHRRGHGYILVTAKAEGSHNTPAYHVLDAKAVYEQIGMSE